MTHSYAGKRDSGGHTSQRNALKPWMPLSGVCTMTHPYVCHDSSICVPWLIHMCAMTHSYIWCDSFICVIWLIHMCAMTHSCAWHDSFTCRPWLIHTCAMTHSYAGKRDCSGHTSHRHALKLSTAEVECAMTHSYMWHDSLICVTWLIYMCAMSHSCTCHDSPMCRQARQ